MPRNLPNVTIRPGNPRSVTKPPESSASQVRLTTSSSSYNILIGQDLYADLATHLAALTPGRSPKFFVVTSNNIWRLWSKHFLASFLSPALPKPLFLLRGEAHKRLSSLESLADQLVSAGADRDSLLLALGGGIIGDITGFLAAVYMRGIPYVHVPTTLLAQVDSAIGGKTGVNLMGGKNLIGSFHQPLAVVANTDTLRTLPPRELRAGLQESIKAGIIRSPRLFHLLESDADTILDGASPQHTTAITRVIVASVRIKAEVVAADEYESGLRMILNFGHTVGHAIEAATGYKRLLHGEAVAWGSIAATHLARARGIIPSNDAARIEKTILRYGPLPSFTSTAKKLVDLTASDKKVRSGTRSFILPVSIGKVDIVPNVTIPELLQATESMLALMRATSSKVPRELDC